MREMSHVGHFRPFMNAPRNDRYLIYTGRVLRD